MLNKIMIQGRLTAEPELRHTANGTPVASFTVACEQDFKANDGTRKTDFLDCVAWNKAGTFVSDYFHKGDMIIVSGRLTIREWTDKAGNKRRTAEIVVEGSYFGGSKKTAQNAEFTPGEFADLSDIDGDIPF